MIMPSINWCGARSIIKRSLKVPGSPRDPHQGDPLHVFRYDQDYEFIQAIAEGRPCDPSFLAGVRAQAVMDAMQQSDREKRWVEIPALN